MQSPTSNPTAPHLSGSKPAPRNATLDFIRGVLILGVVAVHFGGTLVSQAALQNISFHFGLALNQLFHISVPGFIFLSGYTNATRYNRNALMFYKRRLRTVVVPYIVVNSAYVLWAGLSPSHMGPHSVKEFLYQFFITGADWPLYFVPVIVQCYLVFPLLFKFLADSHHGNVKRLSLLAALIGLHVLFGLLVYNGKLPYAEVRSTFPFWAAYFYAGMMVGLRRISKGTLHRFKVLGVPLLMAAAAFCYLATTQGLRPGLTLLASHNIYDLAYARPIMIVYNALAIWVVALVLLEEPGFSLGFFDWLGRNSLMVFLWHMPVMRLLYGFFPLIGLSLRYPPFALIVILVTASLVAVGNEGWRIAKAYLF